MDPPQAIIDRFFVDGDGNAAAGPSWPRVDSSLYPGNSVTYGEVTADGARALAALFQKHSPFPLGKVVYRKQISVGGGGASAPVHALAFLCITWVTPRRRRGDAKSTSSC